MSLDKAIAHGKEKRKPYPYHKRVDATCRNHGGCPYCLSARKYHDMKLAEKARDEMLEHDHAPR